LTTIDIDYMYRLLSHVSAVIATAVNAEGRREIIGFDIVNRVHTGLDWVLALTRRSRSVRRRAGDLRRPRRHQSRDRELTTSVRPTRGRVSGRASRMMAEEEAA
jgi:hypothetical protein